MAAITLRPRSQSNHALVSFARPRACGPASAPVTRAHLPRCARIGPAHPRRRPPAGPPNVVDERAPFDHPEIFVPNNDHDGRADENLFVVGLHVPAVGKLGRAVAGQPQIETFLDLEPSLPTP